MKTGVQGLAVEERQAAAGKFPGSNGDMRVHRLGSFQPAVALHVKAMRNEILRRRIRTLQLMQAAAQPG